MKKLFSLLLALPILFSLALPVRAEETGIVEYRKGAFSFGPGSLHYPTDLFPELKDVMPGDKVTQRVTIRHKGSKNVSIRLYIKAEGSDENADFIRQLKLSAEHRGGEILYDDGDAAKVSDWTRLATLAPGGSAHLDLTLTVPADLGNGYENDLGTVVWRFKAEEIPLNPDSPKTGDNIRLWLAALTASALTLAVLLRRKTAPSS